MLIPDDIAGFLQGPVLMTLGTRDDANRPMIARGTAVRACGPGTIRISFCLRHWPETLANLLDNGWLALVVVQPTDYRAFQFKGRATIAPPTPRDLAEAHACRERTYALLGGHGIPREQIAAWAEWDELAMAEMAVERIFEQTPGPRAGRVVT